MTDSAIYCTIELSAPPQVQDESRLKLKDVAVTSSLMSVIFCTSVSHRLRLSCLVMVALGFSVVILLSLLIYRQILCFYSKDSTCAHCPSCPDLWMRNGSHCYYFSMEKRDWNSSLKFCMDQGSHLLTFPDNQEVNPFQEYLGQDFYWIGLRNDDGWKWEGGPALRLRIVSNSLIQKCGAIHRAGFQASSCEVPLQWICKKVLH